jgi:cell wall assembly regulator SMI1
LLLNLTFMPLEAVIESKDMLDGMIGTEFLEPDWWRRDWVPFLENGGGDLLCLDAGGFETGNVGQVLWFDHGDADREIIHASIDDFCIDLLNRMSTGMLELA